MQRGERVAGQQLGRRVGDKELHCTTGQRRQIELAIYRSKRTVASVKGNEGVMPRGERSRRQQR